MPIETPGHIDFKEPTIQDLNDNLEEYGHELQAEFEMTHLDYIADKLSDLFDLSDDDFKITGDELLNALNQDFTTPNTENIAAKTFIENINDLDGFQDYPDYETYWKDHYNWLYNDEFNTDILSGIQSGTLLVGLVAAIATIPIASITPPAIALPVLLSVVFSGPILGGVIGAKNKKKNKAEREARKQKRIDALPHDYQEYTQEWNDSLNEMLEEFVSSKIDDNDDAEPLLSLNKDEFPRLKFGHKKAKALTF